MNRSQYLKISYSQSWEDAEILLEALNIESDDTVFSITSGGCNSLALLSELPAEVHTVDINPAQNYLLELKYTAVQELEYQACLKFLGIASSASRIECYAELTARLSHEARMFWEKHQSLIRKGVVHSGRFEKYLQIFRKYVLSLAHSKISIDKLLEPKPIEEQKQYYNRNWDTWRWRLLFYLFFSKLPMKLLGRSPAMFRFTTKGRISEHYLTKTKEAFTRESFFYNCYNNYILKGNYITEMPLYLTRDIFAKLNRSHSGLNIKTGHILEILRSTPDNYFTKFNLSDIFEPLSETDTAEVFKEILRTAKEGSRIIFWNNLVERGVPEVLQPNFHRESELEKKLSRKEKVFFYERMNIYTLRK